MEGRAAKLTVEAQIKLREIAYWLKKCNLRFFNCAGCISGYYELWIQVPESGVYYLASFPARNDYDEYYAYFQIRRYNTETQELATLYHDSESQITYTVEMWVLADGILFAGDDWSGGQLERHIFRFDCESGGITPLFGPTGDMLAENLVVSSGYTGEKANPTNPWGLELAPRDLEVNGQFHVVLQNFAGEVFLDGSYPLSGYYQHPDFYGADDTYAYFLDSASFDGDT